MGHEFFADLLIIIIASIAAGSLCVLANAPFAKFSLKTKIYFCIGCCFVFQSALWLRVPKPETDIEGVSIPIALRPDLVGKVIKPISVVNDGGSTMLVGKDLKLYSLLGVQLESGLSTTDMVGKELIVYKKGEVTCIGVNNKPGITDIPTQIGYTNK